GGGGGGGVGGGEGEVVVGGVVASAEGDQPAVGLQHHGGGVVVARADRGRDRAAPVEACVERAVRVVAGQREILVGGVVTGAGGDQLGVRLQRERGHPVAAWADRGRGLSARAGARLERAGCP